MAQLTHDTVRGIGARARARDRACSCAAVAGRVRHRSARFRTREGRELIEARNPTTGHALMMYLDEIDAIEAVS